MNPLWLAHGLALRVCEVGAVMIALLATFGLAAALEAADEPVSIAPAAQENGILVHEVTSPYQAQPTQIRVLLPAARKPDRRDAVIYVLPVEKLNESRYGNGMAEVQKLDLANKHGIIFVAPTFAQLPWYADHPSDAAIRQESYFLKVVVPYVERTYAAKASPDGRLLLGFSKSGFGAWSLLLRHPETFGKAAAWDAPLAMDQLGKYGTTPIFGTQENFERYRLPDLVAQRGESLGSEKRLILTGYGKTFRGEHVQMHELLKRRMIPHVFVDGPARSHDWHSGWVDEAVKLLLAP